MIALALLQFFTKQLFRLVHIGSPAQVSQDDVLVLQFAQQFGKIVEMYMLAEPSTVLVAVFEESAFDD